MNELTYLAIIPARGGSKGLPRKNLLTLEGLPLIAWSIKHAQEAEKISRIVVSTDDLEIAAVAKEYGAEVPFLRPSDLAQDNTPTEPVMLHAVNYYRNEQNYQPDAIILLQPTSPLRTHGTLSRAITTFENTKSDSLLSVCENHHFFWKNKSRPQALYNFQNRPRRQDIQDDDRWFRENGSIYITKTNEFLRSQNRLCGEIAMHVMSEEESWEIDSGTDFKILSCLMKDSIK